MDLKNKNQRLEVIQAKIDKYVAQEIRIRGEMIRTNRKMRTRRLIEMGAILEKVGLVEMDKEFLVGCFMEIRKIEDSSEKWHRFKDAGRAFLNNKSI